VLTESEYPLPPELAALRPRAAYLLCATPRSGSTLLCDLLDATGVAGHPEEYFEALRGTGRPRQPREYFEGVDDPELFELLPRSEPPLAEAPFHERLADVVREATTPNGVFGAKVMWGYHDDLQSRLARLPALAPLDSAGRFARVLGDVRYVHVRREDVVAQAISLWRAVQTREWRAGDEGEAPEPRYSFTGIDHLVQMLRAHDRRWRRWFAARAIVPLELRYEQVADDPGAAVLATLELIGVASELATPVPAPRLQRQSGAGSAEWAERYRRESRGLG
jgi:trehalose 2-sulfotransferase